VVLFFCDSLEGEILSFCFPELDCKISVVLLGTYISTGFYVHRP